MNYQGTFQTPNIIIDKYYPHLTGAEITIIFLVIRQTYGWLDKQTGKRKLRDRISQSQFMAKTGLCRRVVSQTIESLVKKGLLRVTNSRGVPLLSSKDRRGVPFLYYAFSTPTCAENVLGLVQKRVYNERNYTKETNTILRGYGVRSVGEILSGY